MTRTETKEMRSVTVVRATCDLCGEERVGDSIGNCQYCGRDFCNQCRKQWEYDPWTGEYNGDYWRDVCEDCDAKVQVYATTAKAIRDRADMDVEELRLQWLDDCKPKKENEPC